MIIAFIASLTDTEKYYYFWVMKTKGWINLLLVVIGITIMIWGEHFILREYALSVGFILLMLGLYRISKSWRAEDPNDLKNT